MADYNVQMKQYNGTSFDNILPHAYLADTATELAGGGGATEIIAQARAGLVQVASGEYVGTGAHGPSNPTVVTVGFKPRIFIIRMILKNNSDDYGVFADNGTNATLPMIAIASGEYWSDYSYSPTYIWAGESFLTSYVNRGFVRICKFITNDTEMRMSATTDWENLNYDKSRAQFNVQNSRYLWLAMG